MRVEGALLFADITGFTGLAERLATRGPDGAERLTEVLDACFHELVAMVVAHGGDVLKFAGDALLAVWTVPAAASGVGLTEAVSRAATCALSFQAALHERVVGGDDRLSLRVNVAAGPLCLSGVGGLAGRRELALLGDTLAQLKEARCHTLPGEVVLSHAARGCLGEHALVEPSAETGWRLVAVSRPLPPTPLAHAAVDDELAAALLRFVPASVLNRLHERQLNWLGELRAVTVLFVRAPPAVGPDEAVAARLQELASVVQAAVLRFDGTLNKASVDETGIMLFAAWGLPPHVHEDDPTRAARAALAARQALAERGLSGAIGMASGLIYAGVIGSDARAEYTGIGDAVNLAARLTEAAEGEITTDGETARLAGRELVFSALGQFAAKGKARPIPTFRPTGAEAHRGRPGAEIVGRAPQRQAIRELVSALSAGRGGEVVVLEALAGLGKSRLVAEAVEAAQTEGCAVWVAEADSVETCTAYFAWRSVFAQALGLRGTASPEACRQRVTTWLERRPDLAERQTLLNVVLPVALPERALTAQMTGEVRAENTNAALVSMLGDLAGGRPVLLVVEDGHWLDDESRLLLRRVLRDVPGLSLLFATRPVDPPPPEYRLLLESAGPRALRLEALSEPESATLVARRLGVPAIPDAASALIFPRAEGNPFFTEEMALAFLEFATRQELDQGVHWSLLGKGMNLVRLGRTAEAAPLLARATAWADEAASAPEQIWAHGMKALCHLGNGELDAARVEADATLQRVEAAPPTAYWTQQSTAALCETYRALARRADSEAERAEMRDRFRRAVQGMRRFARVFPFGGAHAAYWQGAFAEDGGRPSAARRQYDEARRIARRFNQRYEEGLAEAALRPPT